MHVLGFVMACVCACVCKLWDNQDISFFRLCSTDSSRQIVARLTAKARFWSPKDERFVTAEGWQQVQFTHVYTCLHQFTMIVNFWVVSWIGKETKAPGVECKQLHIQCILAWGALVGSSGITLAVSHRQGYIYNIYYIYRLYIWLSSGTSCLVLLFAQFWALGHSPSSRQSCSSWWQEGGIHGLLAAGLGCWLADWLWDAVLSRTPGPVRHGCLIWQNYPCRLVNGTCLKIRVQEFAFPQSSFKSANSLNAILHKCLVSDSELGTSRAR